MKFKEKQKVYWDRKNDGLVGTGRIVKAFDTDVHGNSRVDVEILDEKGKPTGQVSRPWVTQLRAKA